MRKLDRRGKAVLSAAAAAAVIANAGAAWAYWSLNGSGTGVAIAGSAVELKLQAHSDDSAPLYPGGTSSLNVTVTNQNDFPITITSLSLGGTVLADEDHRAAGCRITGVSISRETLTVNWQVPKNTVGAFKLANGLRMTNDSDSACQGATFIIPVRANGQSSAS